MKFTKIDELCVTALRMLAVDMVEKARSGHPGLPLGAAPMAYVLWSRFLRHNPKNPEWPDRDRFILSAGHGSALLYALLHCFGYNISVDDLMNFRQLGSKTPGHPERDTELGIEVTTGPLGQGFAMAVGMAAAERFVAARYNKKGARIVGHKTFVLASDGDMMEGVSSEAASFAGNQRLSNLVCLYDDNRISIEGSTSLAFTEDVGKRFAAYGWNVIRVKDGNDLRSIDSALRRACASKDAPALVIVRTRIGYGSPKKDTAEVHGSPLGEKGVEATRKFFKWKHAPFVFPEEVKAHFDSLSARGVELCAKWQVAFQSYSNKFSNEARRFEQEIAGALPPRTGELMPSFDTNVPIATRVASGRVLNSLAKELPNLIGGSADLAPSNNTRIDFEKDFSARSPGGRNVHFGVREFAMAAITNGMAAHGGVIPYCATFLVFSDYMRAAVRLSALMNLRSIFIFTHDSIGLGEDGPTHQPVEQLASLRLIPNLVVIRPADANETATAWKMALERSAPTGLLLSRQNLPVLGVEEFPVRGGAARGAYVLKDFGDPRLIIIATGSEVHLALAAAANIHKKGIGVRVVSMPSCEVFDAQSKKYRDSVLPPNIVKRITVEAGVAAGLAKYRGDDGSHISIEEFGSSAPIKDVMKHFGITSEHIESIALSFR